MRYFICGGGRYGTHYVHKLREAIERQTIAVDEVVVVDRDPDCRAAAALDSLPHGSLNVTTWREFGSRIWDARDELRADVWVPAPVAPHVIAEWILDWLSARGMPVIPVAPPSPLPAIPFAETRRDGRALLSHAPGRCPLGCIEPAICAITGDDRWWEMRNTVQEWVEADAARRNLSKAVIGMFFCKHHCDPGEEDVGGIRFETIFSEAERVSQAAQRGERVGLATMSSCHAVVNLYERPVTAGLPL